MNPSRRTSSTSILVSLLVTGGVPFALSLSAAGCGGSSGGGGGQVTNALAFSPVDQAVLKTGIQDRNYVQTFTVTSGGTAPYRFTNVNNSLPPGLFLITTSADGGALATSNQTSVVGFPTNTGATQLTFQAFDVNNDRSDPFYTFSITPRVASEKLNVLPVSGTILLTPQVGTAYVNTVTVGNGTANYNWRVVFGGLPPGLTFTSNPTGTNSTEGGISGTPTQSGTWFFAVEVDDQSNPQRSSGAVYQLNVVQ